ncbi:hypothetical protein [Natrarchaeobaculum sulfurireducens]|uniref:Uncharacterized protein n=1 Tax=Natrarchaeobaculum sulfurireducens TaxID=2044521 RepID=A0A346PPK3_9EURY|nr:hypothetical protein [Natrarchaeobaculum sulfurireducens]AXR81448.1 hypothetical protein AArcMg_1433 [Natrarchaeobaculum sulfurireducens]
MSDKSHAEPESFVNVPTGVAAQTTPGALPTLYDGNERLTPYVRYGKADGKRLPVLHHVTDPIPEEAVTVGPVYYLTRGGVERLEDLREEPYAVREESSIASALSKEADKGERALYPVYVESDSLEEVGDLSLMLDELHRFVEEYLEVEPSECTWWYSGSRSIHVHVPRLVSPRELPALKEIAEEFNSEGSEGVEVDPCIYGRKRQFRLPGVEHAKTGMHKVRVEPGMTHGDIIREATQGGERPATYEEYLSLTMSSIYSMYTTTHTTTHSYYGAGIEDTSLVSQEYEGGPGQEYINEFEHSVEDQPWRPSDEIAAEVWEAYNAKEFSPYAKTGSGERSVAVVRVRGGAFGSLLYDRPEESGTTKGGRLPCYIYGAIGGDGEYRKAGEYAPLLLSKHDYDKVEGSESGEHLIVIGGRSRRSRVLNVDLGVAIDVASLLNNHGRKAALSHLREAGYDVGKAGQHGADRKPSEDRGTGGWYGETKASRLQRKATTEGVEALSYNEQVAVASRLLRVGGWGAAWRWFRERYDEDFEPETTHKNFKALVEAYDDLSHVTVPDSPDE